MKAPGLATRAASQGGKLENRPTKTPGQGVHCAGCGRRSRRPRAVKGWRDDRPVPLCARCANAWRKYAAGFRP
jgi:hypothetical protein